MTASNPEQSNEIAARKTHGQTSPSETPDAPEGAPEDGMPGRKRSAP